MRKPWQELGSPTKGLGGGNRGSATEVGLLPLAGETEGGEALTLEVCTQYLHHSREPFKELAAGTHYIGQELRVFGH